MKQLKFDHSLAQSILLGKKTSTFRVLDDKDIRNGDRLRIVDKVAPDDPSSWLVLGEATVIECYEKPISQFSEADYASHEAYESPQDMLAAFRGYYGDELSLEELVKVIRFDFIAYEQPKPYFEAVGQPTKQSSNDGSVPSSVKMYADGGSRGNPGPSALGFVVYDEQGNVVKEGSKYLGITTNNQAEYHALKAGMEWCHEHKVKRVKVFMDSLLVVNQMKGIFKVKNRDLWPLFEAIKTLQTKFEEVHFSHVPRELNKAADAEVNKALDALSS